MEPLIHQFSKQMRIPLEKLEINYKENAIYNPYTQTTLIEMGSKSTACHQATDGTKPKNEADKVMDDN